MALKLEAMPEIFMNTGKFPESDGEKRFCLRFLKKIYARCILCFEANFRIKKHLDYTNIVFG